MKRIRRVLFHLLFRGGRRRVGSSGTSRYIGSHGVMRRHALQGMRPSGSHRSIIGSQGMLCRGYTAHAASCSHRSHSGSAGDALQGLDGSHGVMLTPLTQRLTRVQLLGMRPSGSHGVMLCSPPAVLPARLVLDFSNEELGCLRSANIRAD